MTTDPTPAPAIDEARMKDVIANALFGFQQKGVPDHLGSLGRQVWLEAIHKCAEFVGSSCYHGGFNDAAQSRPAPVVPVGLSEKLARSLERVARDDYGPGTLMDCDALLVLNSAKAILAALSGQGGGVPEGFERMPEGTQPKKGDMFLDGHGKTRMVTRGAGEQAMVPTGRGMSYYEADTLINLGLPLLRRKAEADPYRPVKEGEEIKAGMRFIGGGETWCILEVNPDLDCPVAYRMEGKRGTANATFLSAFVGHVPADGATARALGRTVAP